MTDTPPAAPPAEPPAGPSVDQKLDAMKTEIIDTVKSMISTVTGHAAPAAPAGTTAQAGPQDLQAQIDAAVAKVNSDRDAQAAADAHAAEHDALKAAASETPPMERKRVHRFMGWGEPAK